MPLYQPSVLKQQLKLQDKDLIEKAYKKFSKYFLNPTIQDNIRSSKEEEYQGIFLTELFVNILGYTLKPKADFNLVAEYKNQTNARKADGAILHNDTAIGVIELKGTNTKDLESIRKQAFDYKANQKGCVYVVTSNFEKLRFYINDATEYEEFNLFELTPERFALFYLCLQKDTILNNIPLGLKEASVVEEEKITKQFYKDYSLFKRELYRDLVKRNAKRLKNEGITSSAVQKSEEDVLIEQRLEKNVKLTLFKKSQKLIDRFLFIFFAEDRGLLPPNSTLQIIDKWKADVDFGDERPLYNLFKQYFTFLDQGRQGTNSRAEIYAYNGGLFKEDTLLDSLELDNALLATHTNKLAAYDFESQVDVNILGHIFENSLNEIESVNAEIEGADFDKQKSKRKKDGVFYTPKYITKYIVENTVGKLCEEKKTALGFKEEEYYKGRKNRQKATVEKLIATLDTYRDWLLQLTICDPACGSGAFLNQALDFLIKEHTYIDELKAKILGGGIVFSDIETTILENNIYGVDLNEESVEIAKLSLWLRTAQPRRKLNNLNSNIKCGNSLIDSKAVAGDKAFHWETAFAKVFEKGGFDVVIGNPPYVRQELLNSKDKEWLVKSYEVGNGTADLYVYFYEKSINCLKSNGLIGFITPNKFYKTQYGRNLRTYLNSHRILELIDFFELKIFEDASTDSQISIIKKNTATGDFNYSPITDLVDFSNKNYENLIISQNQLQSSVWTFLNKKNSKILNKINNKSIKLVDYRNCEILLGIKTAANEAFIIDKKTKELICRKDNKSLELIKPYVSATDIMKYHIENFNKNFLINTEFDIDVSKYTAVVDWLKQFEKKLMNRQDKGMHHYNLRACTYNDAFSAPKIIFIYTAVNHNFYYDDEGFYVNNSCFIIKNGDKFLSAYLNSSFFKYYKKLNFVAYGNAHTSGRVKLDRNKMNNVPVPLPNNFEIRKIEFIVDELKLLNKKVYINLVRFQTYIQQTFQLQKLSKKLQNWHELEFGDFIKELNKAIKANNKLRVKDGLEAGVTSSAVEMPTLTKKDEFEWLELFEENKKKAQELQTQINQTDKEIDAMVYELYGLTEEEIAIVENS